MKIVNNKKGCNLHPSRKNNFGIQNDVSFLDPGRLLKGDDFAVWNASFASEQTVKAFKENARRIAR